MARKSKYREQYVKQSRYLRKRAKSLQKEYGKWLGARNEVLEKFKPISQMGEKITSKDLRRAIKQMGTVKKQLYKKNIEKKLSETIDMMNKAGYDWVNRSNVLPFINMMEQLHGSALESIYGSGYVASEVEKRLSNDSNSIDAKELEQNFQSWLERADADPKAVKKRNLNLRKKFNPLPGSGSNDY